jgi:hypothetical protein
VALKAKYAANGKTRKWTVNLPNEKTSGSFNTVLRRSIQEGISSVVGRETAVAVEFYLDPSIATKDILAYTVALERMFTLGSKLIEDRCAQALYSNMGIAFQRRENYKLNNYVEDAKKKWLLGETSRQ